METPEEFYESIRKGEGFTYVDTVVNNITRKTMMTGLGLKKWNDRLKILKFKMKTQLEVMPIHPEKIPVVRAEIFKACM